MRDFTGGKEQVVCGGKTVRRLIYALDERYPGMKDALMRGDKLRPDIACAIDGQVTQLGVLQPLKEDNEVLFMPAVSGGVSPDPAKAEQRMCEAGPLARPG